MTDFDIKQDVNSLLYITKSPSGQRWQVCYKHPSGLDQTYGTFRFIGLAGKFYRAIADELVISYKADRDGIDPDRLAELSQRLDYDDTQMSIACGYI
tara:strand:- start:13174 stop:13464 length:291 start_codon:yes stop_codon:yes gene_type:complete